MIPRRISKPKGKCLAYYRGWMLATAEMWRDCKPRVARYRRVTYWHPMHSKRLPTSSLAATAARTATSGDVGWKRAAGSARKKSRHPQYN